MQMKHLREIRSMYTDDFDVIELEEFPIEIRKPENLRLIAKVICENINPD